MYEWKDVKCEQRETKGTSGECGSETVCGGIEGNVVKADVDESKVW